MSTLPLFSRDERILHSFTKPTIQVLFIFLFCFNPQGTFLANANIALIDCTVIDDSFEACNLSINDDVSTNDTCDEAEYYALVSAPIDGDIEFEQNGAFSYSNSDYGSFTFSYEACYIISNYDPEICQWGVTQMTVKYLGPDADLIEVKNKDASYLFGSFNDVSTGDVLFIENNTGITNGQYNTWKFYIDGVWNADIHASCSVDLLNNTYGDFLVLSYTSNGIENTILECVQADVFINLQCSSGSISGFVSEDLDADEIGDLGIEGVTILLLDGNGNPALDVNGNLIPDQVTDIDGYYEFINLSEGDYIVMQVQPESFSSIMDGDYSDDGDGSDGDYDQDDQINITLGSSESDTDNNFIEQANGNISGYVYKQVIVIDDDGNTNTFNVPIVGVSIKLKDSNGNIIIEVVSNNDGLYEFLNYPPSTYSVNSPAPAKGCEDVYDHDDSISELDPDGAPDPLNNSIPVVLSAGETDADNNFVDANLPDIGNFVFYDLDFDGQQDASEWGVNNLSVSIYSEGIDGLFYTEDDFLEDMVLTNENGSYLIEAVPSGEYYIFIDPYDLPENYEFTIMNGGSTDNNDSDLDENGFGPVFTVVAGQLDDMSLDAGIIFNDPCENWTMGDANSQIAIGVVANPDIIASEFDIVNLNFFVINISEDTFSNVLMNPELSLLSEDEYAGAIFPTWLGDPNGNNTLDPDEIWFYTAVNTFNYNQGDIFIISAGVSAESDCGTEIGAAADLLFTSGMNMDVDIDEASVYPGDDINITLTTRLLIDEDLVLNPGTTIINTAGVDVEIALQASQWEARDLRIKATGLNDGLAFDPFNPPAGMELLNFCEQGGIEGGRNTGNILDESEPVDSFRDPCTGMNEDDKLCEYPDWVFCYKLTVPDDFNEPIFRVEASDEFSVWKADEFPINSGFFEQFVDISDKIDSGGYDDESVIIKPINSEVNTEVGKISDLNIYPNPAVDYMILNTGQEVISLYVEIYDVLGLKVWSGKTYSGEEIYLDNIQSGEYVIKIYSSNLTEMYTDRINVMK